MALYGPGKELSQEYQVGQIPEICIGFHLEIKKLSAIFATLSLEKK